MSQNFLKNLALRYGRVIIIIGNLLQFNHDVGSALECEYFLIAGSLLRGSRYSPQEESI